MALASVATEQRFIFIIQRGAADGLDILQPYGDPAYAGLRGQLIGDAKRIPLDGLFALHPSLVETGKMYAQQQALFVHAVASPYRDRSHFDGQNVLETGGTRPYEVRNGWLNRLAAMLPQTRSEAIAIASTMPAALRGPTSVLSYAPSVAATPSDDVMMRAATLYDRDPQLHALWAEALDTQKMAGVQSNNQSPSGLGKLTAGFLSRPDGPRIAMLETGGWDTHSAQLLRLNVRLKALDALLVSLRDGLGPIWGNTTVLVATEFGRTAAVNGTGGTDHGTGTVAMLVGGAVKGGRVIADWPGLSAANLYEGRDLRPTARLDSLIAAVAGESLRLDPARVMRGLFPGVPADTPMGGLIRA